jgi:hypothetical protein
MLIKLIKEASMYGWHVVASADVSAKVCMMSSINYAIVLWGVLDWVQQ